MWKYLEITWYPLLFPMKMATEVMLKQGQNIIISRRIWLLKGRKILWWILLQVIEIEKFSSFSFFELSFDVWTISTYVWLGFYSLEKKEEVKEWERQVKFNGKF